MRAIRVAVEGLDAAFNIGRLRRLAELDAQIREIQGEIGEFENELASIDRRQAESRRNYQQYVSNFQRYGCSRWHSSLELRHF